MTMFVAFYKFQNGHYNLTGITAFCHIRRLGGNVITRFRTLKTLSINHKTKSNTHERKKKLIQFKHIGW